MSNIYIYQLPVCYMHYQYYQPIAIDLSIIINDCVKRFNPAKI